MRHDRVEGLFLDGRPIALKCNYLTGNGGFTYKITYDEAFARFSPGVLLELDNIEEMHRRPGPQWLDSCAVPDHFMMNRLWTERRVLQSLTLATSRWVGNAVVGALLAQLDAHGLQVRGVVLDSGFDSGETLLLLQGRGLSYTVPLRRKGKGG